MAADSFTAGCAFTITSTSAGPMPLTGDFNGIVAAAQQIPQAVLINGGVIAMQPDVGENDPNSSRDNAGYPAKTRASCQSRGRRITSSPTAFFTGFPLSSTTSAAMPTTGPEKAQGFSGCKKFPQRMPPLISVPAGIIENRFLANLIPVRTTTSRIRDPTGCRWSQPRAGR